jgi:hypothetical protein
LTFRWVLPERLSRRQTIFIVLGLLLVAGFLRYYRCLESVHPDSLKWFMRSRKFWHALSDGNLRRTNQAPHPGVILMWLSGAMLKLRGLMHGPIDERSLLALKLPGVVFGTLSSALTFPLLQKLLGAAQWRPALVVAALLSTEPLLIEQSRLAHLDMVALGLVWLGMLASLIAYEHRSWRWALGAGFCFGAGCLTKLSVAPLPAALMVILLATTIMSRFRDRRGLMVAAVVTVAAVATIYALWPALWAKPIDTLASVLHRTEKIAANGNRARGSNGRVVLDTDFYVRYLLGMTPVETGILAAFGAAVAWFVRPLRKHYLWLVLATLPYLVLISLAKKKLGRYVLPATPMLLLLAGIGIAWLGGRLRGWRRLQLAFGVGLCLLFVGRFVHAARLLPSAVQCTPWFGTECTTPFDMYFLHDVAKAIERDWHGRRPPRAWNARTQLMAPWLVAKSANKLRSAHYIVVWDFDFADAEEGRLPADSALREYVGEEIAVLRHHGRVALRVYRAR